MTLLVPVLGLWPEKHIPFHSNGTSGRSRTTGGNTCGVDRDLTDEGNGEDRTLQMVTAAEGRIAPFPMVVTAVG